MVDQDDPEQSQAMSLRQQARGLQGLPAFEAAGGEEGGGRLGAGCTDDGDGAAHPHIGEAAVVEGQAVVAGQVHMVVVSNRQC